MSLLSSVRWSAFSVLLWKSGLGWMDSSPALSGYGLDSFKFYSPHFFPFERQDTWNPHKVYCWSDNMLNYLSYNWYFWFLTGTACAALGRERRRGAREARCAITTA